MRRQWRLLHGQWEIAHISDAQFVSQSEAIDPQYGELAAEIVRRDFRRAWHFLPPSLLGIKPECEKSH